MRTANEITSDNLAKKGPAPLSTWRETERNKQSEITLRGGEQALIRPIGKDDRALELDFIEALSPSSRRSGSWER